MRLDVCTVFMLHFSRADNARGGEEQLFFLLMCLKIYLRVENSRITLDVIAFKLAKIASVIGR